VNVTIDVINDSGAAALPSTDQLQLWAEAVVEHMAPLPKPVTVGLRIVDENEGAAINRSYRERDYATNVLSFGSELPEVMLEALDEIPLGDLVICAPVVAREALEQDKALDAHWAHMLVHGLLHLQGFDHETDDQADTMEALETRILAGLGFDNPYRLEHQ
jgi:probable rRNA maturation factor